MLGEILKKTWPLFLGIGFLMLGNGLQGTLVSWRATYEGFAPSTTGWIMTGYYTGFLVGSFYTPRLINSVGYIRVFAALASVASTAVLIQLVYINPVNWFAMRLLSGFCFAGTYVIAESWLNASANNESRGQTLSFYMLVSYSGMAGGQWLLSAAHPSGFSLFVLASVLLSLGLVPILLRRTDVPDIQTSERLGILQLFKVSPSGVISIFVSAVAHGAMFSMGAVFAVKVGMSVTKTALFMSSFITLGALAQWPLGWLSDKIDRRLVILGSGVIATLLCIAMLNLSPHQPLFFIAFAGLGAFSLPIYSIAVAHTNDRLDPSQMTGASSTIVLTVGIGAILGPATAGYLLNTIGEMGFIIHLSLAHFAIVIGILLTIFKRKAVAVEDQTHYQTVCPAPTTVMMEAVALEAEDSMETDATAISE